MTAGRTFRREASAIVSMLSIALGASLVLWSAMPSAGAASAVTLESVWADALDGPLFNWTQAMAEAPTKVTVRNTKTPGDLIARERLIDPKEKLDFVVAGAPLSAEDREHAKAEKREFVEIPIAATGVVFLLRPPYPNNGFQVVDAANPDEGLPELYSGPLALPDTALFDFFTQFESAAGNLATHPDFVEEFNRRLGRSKVLVSDTGQTYGIVRSDPGALNLHLATLLKQRFPAKWEKALTAANRDPKELGERWPLTLVPSRSSDAALLALVNGDGGAFGGTAEGGLIGITTLGSYERVKQRATENGTRPDRRRLQLLEVKNAAGNWVVPSKQTLQAGLNAGVTGNGFTPNAALTDRNLATAYPLTYVSYLVAPTKGLSPDKANALATLVRYVVTSGQKAATDAGDPALPDPLVKRALELADALVKSNCDGPGLKAVETTDPGPYAPAPGALTGVGRLQRCDSGPVAPTTAPAPPAPTVTGPYQAATTTAPTTTAAPAAPPPANNNSAPRTTASTARSSGPAITTRGSPPSSDAAPTTTTAAAPSTTRAGPSTDSTASAIARAVELPFGLPQPSNNVFDRLTTMILGGGGMYVGLRRLLWRRIF